MIDSALAAEAAAVSQSLPLSFTGHVRCTHSVKWLLTLTDKKEVRAGGPGQEMERESDYEYRGDYGLRGWCSPRSPSGEKRRVLNDSNNEFFPMEGLLTHDCSPCTRSARLSIRGKAERTFI